MKSFFTVFCFLMLFMAATFTASFAQINWTKYPSNPVMGPGLSGSWDDLNVGLACVILVNDTCHMWYDGNWDDAGSRNNGIGHATSVDGINWSKDALNPVLLPTAGSWDEGDVSMATVLFNNTDSLFHMWYVGWQSLTDPGYIGHATSPDGGHWTKDTIVLSPGLPGSWDDAGFTGPCVILIDTTYHMWYDGWENGVGIIGIGHATSSDGIAWQKDPANPVFNPGNSNAWDYPITGYANVIYDGFRFHMYYTGGSWFTFDIGYAFSQDGTNWTKYSNNPVLQKGLANSWDDYCVHTASVMFDQAQDSLIMWYTGASNGVTTMQIGYATAPVTIIHVPGVVATIQEAIDIASDGNVVLVADGTYFENINFKGKAITVASHYYFDGDTSHISNTIINGSNPTNPDSGSVVYFISGEDTNSVLYGFTITDGTGTIGLYTFGGVQYPFRGGGGILCWNSSGGRFVSNIIINNTISDNEDVMGGGLGTGDFGSNAWVILENNTIINNTVNSVLWFAFGGGVALTCNGKLVGNTVSYNSCTATLFEANGGGIKITTDPPSSPRTVLIKGNRITHNFAEGKKVSGHHGAKGGGIVNHYCKVTILENEILYNQLNAIDSGDAYGAGICMYNANGGSIISCNTISYNTIADSITNGGGGISILMSNVPVPIINNIISENSASNGGGIYLNNSNSEIINNTITQNDVSANGGGLFASSSNPIVVNNILWDNQAVNGGGIYPSNLTKVRYSDIQGGSTYTGTGNINTDPLFADTLIYNLSDSSPCVGTGVDSIQITGTWYYCPATDFAGNPRPNSVDDLVDMGALESSFPSGIIKEDSDYLPKVFSLKQNYPNPFNPTTNIEFSIPKAEFVTLKIYNLLGQEVTELVSEKIAPGNYKYTWDASAFASGIYFYRLQTSSFVQTNKMIYMR